jgi:protein TonB
MKKVFTLTLIMLWTCQVYASPVEKDSVYRRAEIMPISSVGDDSLINFFERKIHSPSNLVTVEKVFLYFVVRKDGTITDLKVLSGKNKDCNREALRVAKTMPAWIPGQQNGKNVSVGYVLPILFLPKKK